MASQAEGTPHQRVLALARVLAARVVLGDLAINRAVRRLEHRVALLVLVQVAVVDFLDERLLHLLGSAIALDDFDAIRDSPHLKVGHRCTLARMDVLRGHYDSQRAIDFEHVALAD